MMTKLYLKMEVTMNRDVIKGNWKQLKGQAQKRWGELTDDELNQVEGDATRLSGLIQEKYGKSRTDADREVDEWSRNLH